MTGSEHYGSKFWCVVDSYDNEQRFHFCADRIEVLPSGALMAWGGYRKDKAATAPDGQEIAVLGMAPESWAYFYAASCLDGSMVAVDKDD
jgi:hypothetical protein